MAQTLLWLIIAFVTLEFVVNSVLSWLNTKWMAHPVPPELVGLYDEEKYRKQQEYMKTNKRVSLIARCVSFSLTLVILGFGLLGWLDSQCKSWTDVPILQLVLFLVIYNLFNTACPSVTTRLLSSRSASGSTARHTKPSGSTH